MSLLTREIFVGKKPIQMDDDPGVAEFGAVRPRRTPAERVSREDSADTQAQRLLREDSVARALYFGYEIGDISTIPVYFPYAEHFKSQPFDEEHWDSYKGNLESERTRVRFMLDTYGAQRGFPIEFIPLTQKALNSRNVFSTWERMSSDAGQAAQGVFQRINAAMVEAKHVDPQAEAEGYHFAYQSRPILYQTTPDGTTAETELWERALEQITAEINKRNYKHVSAFLDLYARVKDPITTVSATASEQRKQFMRLLRQSRRELRKHGIKTIEGEQGRTLVAQLALESSFLSLPAARDIFYTRGDGGHHELPYIYVDLKTLPRGEYTDPPVVMERLTEMLQESRSIGKAGVTPITVSYFQIPGEAQPQMFIVDGNNRATGHMLIQYLLTRGTTYENRLEPHRIQHFMKIHQLHPGWEREITLALHVLSPQMHNQITVTDRKIARKLANGRISALLVQEPNFHTIEVESSETYRPEIFLLQPMHQAIYNQDGIAMAIPPKKQTHGRAPGNNIFIEETRPPFLRLRRRYRIHAEKLAA